MTIRTVELCLTCVSQLHRGELEADSAPLFESLGLQDAARPLLGGDDLVASLPVERDGRLGVSLHPAVQADALALRVVLDGASGHSHPQICSHQHFR